MTNIREVNNKKKVAFIQNITEQLQGYMYMSAVLKNGRHTCEVFVDNFEKDILKSLREFKPDIMGFYCVTGNLNWGLSIIRTYKKYDQKCLALLGGPHPTFLPLVAQEEGIDAVSVGESDEVILELCNKYDGTVESISDLQNICVFKDGVLKKNPLRPLAEDLDSLPIPDRSIYDKYRYFRNLDTLPVMASRGCIFNCTYCYSPTFREMYKNLGRFMRFRSPRNVIGELKILLKENNRLRYFIFIDSTFNSNHKWLMDFLAIYRDEIKVPFFCHLRADITNEEQIDALAEANCQVVAFGIEGGSYRLRKELLKRDMSDEMIISIAKKIKAKKITLATTNIFGLPTETLEESYNLIKLNQLIKADVMWALIFQPYPGTELANLALEKKLVDKIDFDKLHSYYHHSILRQKDIATQERLQKMAYYYIKYPKLAPLWNFLVRNAPFPLLFFFFLVTLTLNVKKIYGYSLAGILKYSLLNFRIFSRK